MCDREVNTFHGLWERRQTDSRAPRRPWERPARTVPAEAVSKFDMNSVSAVCHVAWELVTEQDVLCRRAGTSASP